MNLIQKSYLNKRSLIVSVYVKKTLILLIVIICSVSFSYCQEYSKNTLMMGLGAGGSNNSKARGVGVNFSFGYQHDLGNGRLRIVPSANFGTYTSRFISDTRDAYYTSLGFKTNINYDIIKYKSFSVFLGTGGSINYSSGLKGSGGLGGIQDSDYFNEFNFAINGAFGLRVLSEEQLMGCELLLINGSFENKNYFSEISIQLRILFRLK